MEQSFARLERELDDIEEVLAARALPVINLEVRFDHHLKGTTAWVRKLDGSREPGEYDLRINEGKGAKSRVEAYILRRIRNRYERGVIDEPGGIEKIPKRAHVNITIALGPLS